MNFWPTLKYPILLQDGLSHKDSLCTIKSIFIIDPSNLALKIFLANPDKNFLLIEINFKFALRL